MPELPNVATMSLNRSNGRKSSWSFMRCTQSNLIITIVPRRSFGRIGRTSMRLAQPWRPSCCDGAARNWHLRFPRGLLLQSAVLVAIVLVVSPAIAFDGTKLGQGGSLPLGDLMPVISKSAPLRDEIRTALAQAGKKENDVICDGMRSRRSGHTSAAAACRPTPATLAADGFRSAPRSGRRSRGAKSLIQLRRRR